MRPIRGIAVALLLLLLGSGTIRSMAEETTPAAELASFDRLWDYNKPAETEARFRALLPAAMESGDSSILAQLWTQIARTRGLQRDFDGAHEILDSVENLLYDDLKVARIRALLERGRVFNSSKHPEQARPLFLEAWELAKGSGEDFYAVDAAHMMGIIEPPEQSLEWNRTAIEAAERSTDERARGWLGSLTNNTGWTYHDMGRYDEALDLFQRALALRQERGREPEIRIARWCVARALRSLDRIDEALAIQEELLRQLEAAGETDGYVHEELGECLLALDRRQEARIHFARAYEELSKDPGLVESEPARLARIKDLGRAAVPPSDTR